MTVRSRRRIAALILGLLLVIVTQATAQGQMAPPMAAPIGGAPMPGAPVVPAPALPPDGGGAVPTPMVTPGGFGSVGDFSSELQLQDLIRSDGTSSLQPLSVSDYRLRPDATPPRSSSFRLREPATDATNPFMQLASKPANGSAEPQAASTEPDRLAWPAIVSQCLDAPPPGSASACPS